MADVTWIKLTTDMFDHRKIKYLRKLPEGNNIVLIWVMLLTMAGRCNASGMIFLTENIPYTPKMLADELDFEENTVVLALKALEELNMVVTSGNYFSIAGWEEYQNIEGMEKIREQNRLRKQKQRESQKMLLDMSRDSHGTVTQRHATDKEEDIDKDIEKKNKKVKETNHTLFVRLTDGGDYNFSYHADVVDKLEEWFSYKTARKDTYTEQGMKALLRRIDTNYEDYGHQAVCDLIDESMANGWKGIIWDRLKKPSTQSRPQKSNYIDSIKNRVTDVDNW